MYYPHADLKVCSNSEESKPMLKCSKTDNVKYFHYDV